MQVYFSLPLGGQAAYERFKQTLDNYGIWGLAPLYHAEVALNRVPSKVSLNIQPESGSYCIWAFPDAIDFASGEYTGPMGQWLQAKLLPSWLHQASVIGVRTDCGWRGSLEAFRALEKRVAHLSGGDIIGWEGDAYYMFGPKRLVKVYQMFRLTAGWDIWDGFNGLQWETVNKILEVEATLHIDPRHGLFAESRGQLIARHPGLCSKKSFLAAAGVLGYCHKDFEALPFFGDGA